MSELKIFVLCVGMMETNCYIVTDTKNGAGRCIIVDPGDDETKICQRLEKEGLVPEAILLTHGHFDHIGAVCGIKAKYPDVKTFADEAEDALLRDPELNVTNLIQKPLSIEADRLLKDGEEFCAAGILFKNISTPGHTAGSTCFLHEESMKLFCGDTLFECGIGRTDLPTGDRQVLEKSLLRLMKLPDDITCLPGHGRPTTIGKEKMNNPFLSGKNI